jgi:hypothetical protein
LVVEIEVEDDETFEKVSVKDKPNVPLKNPTMHVPKLIDKVVVVPVATKVAVCAPTSQLTIIVLLTAFEQVKTEGREIES